MTTRRPSFQVFDRVQVVEVPKRKLKRLSVIQPEIGMVGIVEELPNSSPWIRVHFHCINVAFFVRKNHIEKLPDDWDVTREEWRQRCERKFNITPFPLELAHSPYAGRYGDVSFHRLRPYHDHWPPYTERTHYGADKEEAARHLQQAIACYERLKEPEWMK